jgi:uncharacterized membrane protein (DUF441 family)
VVPLITILLFGFGLFQAKKGKNDGGLVWLLIISAIVSILPFAFGKSLLYDDDRLFMPVYPYIAALAGIGFAWFYKKVISLLEKSKKFKLQWLVPVILGILFIAPQVFSIIKYYPHLLSYYSEGVGGLKGATNLGMETTYWCETYGETLDYINKNAKDHDIIWAECDNINAYKQFGMLRSNVFCVDTFTPDANWFLFQYRQSEYGKGGAESYPAYQYLHGKTPIFEINIDGVPLLDMYHQDN